MGPTICGARHEPLRRTVERASTGGPSLRRHCRLCGSKAMAASATGARLTFVTVYRSCSPVVLAVGDCATDSFGGVFVEGLLLSGPVGCAVPFGGTRKLLRRARFMVHRICTGTRDMRSQTPRGQRSARCGALTGGYGALLFRRPFGRRLADTPKEPNIAPRSDTALHQVHWAWRCERWFVRL